jgi:hypothetical protein
MTVETGGLPSGPFCPGDPVLALKVGEKDRAPQLVGVNVAEPVPIAPGFEAGLMPRVGSFHPQK